MRSGFSRSKYVFALADAEGCWATNKLGMDRRIMTTVDNRKCTQSCLPNRFLTGRRSQDFRCIMLYRWSSIEEMPNRCSDARARLPVAIGVMGTGHGFI